MRGRLIIAHKVVFYRYFPENWRILEGSLYILADDYMELLIFLHISIIEKFLDVVSYLSVVMYVNFVRAHTHIHTESLVLNLGVSIMLIPFFFNLVLAQRYIESSGRVTSPFFRPFWLIDGSNKWLRICYKL